VLVFGENFNYLQYSLTGVFNLRNVGIGHSESLLLGMYYADVRFMPFSSDGFLISTQAVANGLALYELEGMIMG
jgi:hypothetical protein